MHSTRQAWVHSQVKNVVVNLEVGLQPVFPHPLKDSLHVLRGRLACVVSGQQLLEGTAVTNKIQRECGLNHQNRRGVAAVSLDWESTMTC